MPCTLSRLVSTVSVAVFIAAAAGLLWKAGVHRRTRPPIRKDGAVEVRADKGSLSSAESLVGTWHHVAKLRIFSRYTGPSQAAANLPLVLVHGFGVSGRYFIPLAKHLADDYPIFIPDLPGHGHSQTPVHALDINGLTRALLEWLDALGLGRCVLVGQSMGAQIVVEAAMRQPHRFAGLVLIGPTSDPSAGLATHVWRLLKVAPWERLSLYGIIAIDYLRMGWRLVPECRAMLTDPIEKKIEQLQLPMLLMKGGRDAIVPDQWFETLKERAGTPYAVVIAGGSHAVQHNAPSSVAQALRQYLNCLGEGQGNETTGEEKVLCGRSAPTQHFLHDR